MGGGGGLHKLIEKFVPEFHTKIHKNVSLEEGAFVM